MGFAYVASGPLVRSSYKAAEHFIRGVLRPGKAPAATPKGDRPEQARRAAREADGARARARRTTSGSPQRLMRPPALVPANGDPHLAHPADSAQGARRGRRRGPAPPGAALARQGRPAGRSSSARRGGGGALAIRQLPGSSSCSTSRCRTWTAGPPSSHCGATRRTAHIPIVFITARALPQEKTAARPRGRRRRHHEAVRRPAPRRAPRRPPRGGTTRARRPRRRPPTPRPARRPRSGVAAQRAEYRRRCLRRGLAPCRGARRGAREGERAVARGRARHGAQAPRSAGAHGLGPHSEAAASIEEATAPRAETRGPTGRGRRSTRRVGHTPALAGPSLARIVSTFAPAHAAQWTGWYVA